ncbi:hypothetical protein ACJJTC_015773 [Scirpophaga incertulas]
MLFLTITIVLILTSQNIFAQSNDDVNIPAVDFNVNNIATGKYNFRFHGADNIERQESGGFSNDGQYVVKGLYSYIDQSGHKYTVTYTADKDGFHPVIVDTSESGVTAPPALFAGVPAPVIASLLG